MAAPISSFWLDDRENDVWLGGMSLDHQKMLLEQLRAAQERILALERDLLVQRPEWALAMASLIAQRAALRMPAVPARGRLPRGIWVENIAAMVRRHVADAMAVEGLLLRPPEIQQRAESILMAQRADVRAALHNPKEEVHAGVE